MIRLLLFLIPWVFTIDVFFIKSDNIHEERQHLIDEHSGQVLVVAHRGDWRNFPENSLQAIQSCIDMGVDMVEIDVRLTKDSIPVLLHDKSLNRSTTGKGKIRDHTFEELKDLRLRDGLGRPTNSPIPSLEEAMLAAKDKILVNLDKCEDFIPLVYEVLKKTNTADHVLIGSYDSYDEMRSKAGVYLDSILFMPKIKEESHNVSQYLREYYEHLSIEAVQIKFENEHSPIVAYADSVAKWGSRAWINTITSNRCGGHNDDRAIDDIEGSYGWVVKKGFNMIQTDRPQLLIDFLRKEEK